MTPGFYKTHNPFFAKPVPVVAGAGSHGNGQKPQGSPLQSLHACTKHIDIHFHFIRWVIKDGKLRLIYCPTDEMVADALTKALPSTKVKHFAIELGLSMH